MRTDAPHNLPLAPDGKIIAVGKYVNIAYNTAMARFNADGSVDTSFSGDGIMPVSFTGTPQACAVAVQADGGIVAVGKRTASYTEFAVARVMGGPVLEQRLFAMHDANYNVTGIVDAEDGDVVERYVETPYGTVTVLNGADDKDPSVQEWSVDQQYASDWNWDRVHQGLATDAESGLVYNRARYLHTSVGRFTARDFIGYGDGMNLYRYERSCPVNGNDPSGRLTVHIWRGKGGQWGHASVTLDDQTHISWWPGPDQKQIAKDIFEAPARENQTFEKDEEFEGREQDASIKFWCLDEKKIKAWWIAYKSDKKHKWHTTHSNCSDIAAMALVAGGAKWYDTALWNPSNAGFGVATPESVEKFALEIKKTCECGRGMLYKTWAFFRTW